MYVCRVLGKSARRWAGKSEPRVERDALGPRWRGAAARPETHPELGRRRELWIPRGESAGSRGAGERSAGKSAPWGLTGNTPDQVPDQ